MLGALQLPVQRHNSPTLIEFRTYATPSLESSFTKRSLDVVKRQKSGTNSQLNRNLLNIIPCRSTLVF